MANEIIKKLRSVNNKNVRKNELEVLEKHPEELYFIIGEDNVNTKKRYYDDIKILNEDFEELKKIKKELSTKKEENKELKRTSRLSSNIDD